MRYMFNWFIYLKIPTPLCQVLRSSIMQSTRLYASGGGKKKRAPCRETLSSFDIWLVQLPSPLSFSHSLSTPFSLARVFSRSRLRPRDSRRGVRRTSISVAVSRGFREPRRGFPYRRTANRFQRRGDAPSRGDGG